MYKDLISFIQGITSNNILFKNRLKSKFDAEKNNLTVEEKIDIMNEYKRLEGMAEAFKLIVEFIENKQKIGNKQKV